MAYTKEQRIINSVSGNTKNQRNEKKEFSATGSFNIPNKSGDHMRSIKRDVPINDYDLVNKAYVDNTTGNYVLKSGDEMQKDASLTFNTDNYLASDASLIKMKDNLIGSKAWMTWYDKDDNKIAGIVAHDYSNDTLTTHKHFSIETTNSAGILKTRFEVPYNADISEIQTHDANFTIGGTGNFEVYSGDSTFGGDVNITGDATAATLSADNGATGSFTAASGETITVENGIITFITSVTFFILLETGDAVLLETGDKIING